MARPPDSKKARGTAKSRSSSQGTDAREAEASAGGRTPATQAARARPGPLAEGPNVHMTSTEAQNAFGRVLDTVARNGTVLITRHNATQAVVMSMERYQALTRTDDPELDVLEAEYDAMLAQMQTPEVQQGALSALRATPEELGRAAAAAAARRRKEGR